MGNCKSCGQVVQHFDEGTPPGETVQPEVLPDVQEGPQPEQSNAPEPAIDREPQAEVQPQADPQPAPLVPSAPLTPQQVQQKTEQELNQDHLAYQADRTNGHITPETAKSMFADKGTLGKIGALFGLMVGGAGAGLSHQPNALLEMMNKEMDRDLEAQKNSAHNAQNYYQLNQQNLLNQSHIKSIDAETNVKNWANTKSMMNWEALNQMADEVKKMPPGSPMRAQAERTLGIMNSAVQNENYSISARAAAASALMNPTGGGGGSGGGTGGKNNSPVNYQKLNDLDRRAKMGDPTVSQTDIANATAEAAKIEPMRSFRNNFNSAFQELNKPGAGKLSPNKRESLIESLAGDYSKITGYGADAAHAKMEALLPRVTDWNKTTQDEKLRNNNTMFDTLEAGVPTLKRFGLLNNYQAPQVKKQSAPQTERTEMLNKATGKTYYVDKNKKFIGWK